MGRKLATSLVVILLFAAAGAAFVLLSGDDEATDTAQGTTTTTIATSGTQTSTTLATTTTSPTTAAPTATTERVADACGVEGGPIAVAVNDGVTGARDTAQVDECRFAAADPSWVAVHLVAKPGAEFTSTTVLLHGGAGSWSIVGSGSTACSQAPQQVRVDLGLICSSGGGGGM